MRDPLSRAEHYRKLAVKYRELAKFAQPAYLGDFYRGIAVRYAFMAQEVSERANKEVGFTPDRRVRPEPLGQAEDVATDVRNPRSTSMAMCIRRWWRRAQCLPHCCNG